MFHGWKHTAILMALIAALAIAPCANCQPLTAVDSQQPKPGHECCPKSSEGKSNANACTWMPAVYTASDGKIVKTDLHIAALVVNVPQVVEQRSPVAASRHIETTLTPGAAPPLYISNSAFLI